jgi:hypothetical protein
MNPGDIVENYQGAFAKVIRVVPEGGHTHLSAWVKSPELAEQENVSIIALNEFGLSQVLKGGKNVEGTEVVEAKAPKAEKPAKAPKAE